MLNQSPPYLLGSGDKVYLSNQKVAIIVINDNNERLAFDTWQNYTLDNHPSIYKRIDFTPDEVCLIYKNQDGPKGTWYFVKGYNTAPLLKDTTFFLGEVCPSETIPTMS